MTMIEAGAVPPMSFQFLVSPAKSLAMSAIESAATFSSNLPLFAIAANPTGDPAATAGERSVLLITQAGQSRRCRAVDADLLRPAAATRRPALS